MSPRSVTVAREPISAMSRSPDRPPRCDCLESRPRRLRSAGRPWERRRALLRIMVQFGGAGNALLHHSARCGNEEVARFVTEAAEARRIGRDLMHGRVKFSAGKVRQRDSFGAICQRIVFRQPPSERQNVADQAVACSSVIFCVTRYMPVCRAERLRSGTGRSSPALLAHARRRASRGKNNRAHGAARRDSASTSRQPWRRFGAVFSGRKCSGVIELRQLPRGLRPLDASREIVAIRHRRRGAAQSAASFRGSATWPISSPTCIQPGAASACREVARIIPRAHRRLARARVEGRDLIQNDLREQRLGADGAGVVERAPARSVGIAFRRPPGRSRSPRRATPRRCPSSTGMSS